MVHGLPDVAKTPRRPIPLPVGRDSGKWGTVPLPRKKCPTSQRNRCPTSNGIAPRFPWNQCPTSTRIRTGEIDRIVFLGAAPNLSAEKLKARSLFIVARDDANDAGLRLPGIRAQYEKAPRP